MSSAFCNGAIVCYADWREIIPMHQFPNLLIPVVLNRVCCMKTLIFYDDAIVYYADWREITPNASNSNCAHNSCPAVLVSVVLKRVCCMKKSIFCNDAIECYADWREISPMYQLPTVLMPVVQLCLCQLY